MPRLELQPSDAWRLVWWAGQPTGLHQVGTACGVVAHTSDHDLIAQAVAARGPAAAGRLGGGFALAMLAPDVDGRIVLVRDRLGVVPLYVDRVDDDVVIADTMAEMIALGVAPTPDEDFEVTERARLWGAFDAGTRVVGVRRVPPGHLAEITPGSATVRRWWNPAVLPVRRVAREQAALELRGLLEGAIDATLGVIGTTGIAAHLSGGMDSAVVASLGQRALRARESELLAAISWSPDPAHIPDTWRSPDSRSPDERVTVREAAAALGAPLMMWWPDDPAGRWLQAADEVVVPRRTLTVEAELLTRYPEAGIRHVLSGWGGDEFVSFNTRRVLAGMWREGDLPHLWQTVGDFRRRGWSWPKALARVGSAALPVSLRQRFDTETKISAAILRRASEIERPAARERSMKVAQQLLAAQTPRELRLALLNLGHLSARMEAWHEAGRRFGVTYHYPLLDHRLVEWSLSLPAHVFGHDRQSRALFRAAIDGLVPESVRTSKKQDPVLWEVLARYKRELGDAGTQQGSRG